MSALIKVDHLTRIFDVSKPWLNRVIERLPKALLTAVSDVSFEIEENSVYALVGESGSGKSTIGKIVVGLVPPSKGAVEVEGVDLATETDAAKVEAVRADIQMIFQDPYASLNPRWRVRDIIAEPVAAKGGDTKGLAERLLEQVGLSAKDADKYPHEFSGGQRQRICIARALASGPKIIVCDEPTSALDVSVQAQILNMMKDLQDEHGLAYLFITHDLGVVDHMADRVAVMYLGRIVELGTRDAIFTNPRHPYTKMLMEAVPSLDIDAADTPPPLGELPDPANPPSGCAFRTRCPHAQPRCAETVPELERLDGTRVACLRAEELNGDLTS